MSPPDDSLNQGKLCGFPVTKWLSLQREAVCVQDPPLVAVPGFEGQLPAVQTGCWGLRPRRDLGGRLLGSAPQDRPAGLAVGPCPHACGAADVRTGRLWVMERRLSLHPWHFLQSCPRFPACPAPRPRPAACESPKYESLLPSPVSSAWEPTPPAGHGGSWGGYRCASTPGWQTKAREASWRRIDIFKGNFPYA